MTRPRSSNLLLFLLAACHVPRGDAPPVGRPNIVLILADDMGYGDVRALNPGSRIPTPHLDRLAAQGLTFTDAHTPSSVCTPTRYGLLTGRYCWRGRLKRGVINGYGTRVIETGRQTLGDLLRRAGYHTAMVGKWHLGLDWPRKAGVAGTGRPPRQNEIDFTKPVGDVPNAMGFDRSFLIPASLDFPPYVYIADGRVTNPQTVLQPAQKFPAFLRRGPRSVDLSMPDCLDRLTEEAVAHITARAKQEDPFFLYFPLTAPHKPTLPHARFRKRTQLGEYGDFIVQVDWTVGRVLQAIERAGIAEDTIVIYTSDNGSYMHRYDDPDKQDHTDDRSIQGYRRDNHTANGVLRGTKADIFEAGHRVPCFVRWPRRIDAGGTSAATICLTDFFATFADLLGVDYPEDAGEDSFSCLPQWFEPRLPSERPPVIHHSANGTFAIRVGRHKLIASDGSGGRARPRGKPFRRPYQLFDLAADVGEQTNLIEKEPDVARRMTEALAKIRASGRSVPTR